MLKRARRLAVDFFSNIKETYLKPKEQQAKKNKNEEGENTTLDTESGTKLRNSASIKNVSLKHKRHTISSKRKARHTAASLPTPLNSDPSWQSLRDRSNSDPPTTPTSTINRKSKRTKSELSLRRSTSIGREPLVRRRSLLKKKLELGISHDAISQEKIGSPPSKDKPQDKFQVSFSEAETLNVDCSAEDKSERPIVKVQIKSEPGPTINGESKTRAARDNVKSDWAARRKATSFLNVKDAVKAEDAFDRHNEEIMAIWDKMMAREIDEVRAKYDTEISELLEEILLREGATPPKGGATNPRAGHMRGGSSVAFNNTVEIVEVGRDGVARTSSTELIEKSRPRNVSKTVVRKKGPSPLSISTDAASLLPSSPRSTSPIPSPTKSPTSINATSSPRSSPLPFSSSPTFSPIQPTHSPRSISPSTSPTSSAASSPASSPRPSPNSSPNTSPATRIRNSLDGAPPKPRASVRAWAKVFSGRSHKTRSHEVGGYAMERALDEEIAQVLDKYEREKLELLEEIELRETLEAAMRFDTQRSELLAEISFREAHQVLHSPSRDRRFAIRLRGTLAQRAANGMDATMRKGDETMAKEKIQHNAGENIEKLQIGAEISVVKRHRSVVWRKNASLRAVSRNATRKNVWIAEVPQPLVKVEG